MTSPSIFVTPDREARRRAVDPRHSLIVQAPAGSGKTELLIQRFLGLLGIVDKPEAIVAITFTRKAAGEMLDRILTALDRARSGCNGREDDYDVMLGPGAKEDEAPELTYEQFTLQVARAALARDRARGWDLLANPGRLRVQTIDSLCGAIAGQMPWLAGLGAVSRIQEDAQPLFDEAARRTVMLVEEGSPCRPALETLLSHLDNNASRVQKLLSAMLATRDQWIEMAVQLNDSERTRLEEAMSRALCEGLRAADALIPREVRETWLELARYAQRNLAAESGEPASTGSCVTQWPEATPEHHEAWLSLVDMVLTKDDSWRKWSGLNVNCGFPNSTDSKAKKDACVRLIEKLDAVPGLEQAFAFLRILPPPRYSDTQWKVMQGLLVCLKMAVAQLRVVFREGGTVDFCEVSQAARQALGRVDDPTELALKLDSRIEHLLVDEFQDTSLGQFELLRKLLAGWQPGDRRTLFLVGDPMQSIYRFRQAEVTLFLEARRRGIAEIEPECLQLIANYRSTNGIVEWVNRVFSKIFPAAEDLPTGAIIYSPSQAVAAPAAERAVNLHAFREGEDLDRLEADAVVRIVRTTHEQDPEGSVAILVRARSHLPAIVEALKSAGLKFRAVEIDLLGDRSIVRDLLALTRAMLHLADRVSWLAILRAPWCGLTLEDLYALTNGHDGSLVWERLQDQQSLEKLSEDGRRRASGVRDVLAAAFAERGRWPLRRWVERAWNKLGGPACLESENDLQDAADYFELLEAEQAGCDLRDLDGFRERVDKLFAHPDAQAEEWLQVMTIHKAKGLQFDTVILPGLGRAPRNDDPRLFLFHQWISPDISPDGGRERLLAPIKETGADYDPAYKYLQEIEKRKSRNERIRLLYVAATRAQKRLHLLGHVKVTSQEEVKPETDSMLADLWPALTPAEQEQFTNCGSGLEENRSAQHVPAAVLRRLPAAWVPSALPAAVPWEGAEKPPIELHHPSFEWVGEGLRQAGTVVHKYLQRFAEGDSRVPDLAAIQAALAHAGVAPEEMEWTGQRVQEALQGTLQSERGRWILASHAEAACEYAITGVLDGQIVRGMVDRTFVDEDGVRWIIDYKSSAHKGGGLPEFVDDQQRRYRDQLERYARLLAPLGQPIRLALYFPLLNEWREWAPAES